MGDIKGIRLWQRRHAECRYSSAVWLKLHAPHHTRCVGNGTSLVPSNETRTAGQYAAKSTDARTSFTVVADSADSQHNKITASKTALQPTAGKQRLAAATVLDRYDNPVGNRPLVLLRSRSATSIDPQIPPDRWQRPFRRTVSSQDAIHDAQRVWISLPGKLTDTTVMLAKSAAAITSNPLTAGLTGAGGDGND